MIDSKIYKLLMKRNQKGLELLIDEYGGLIRYIINNTIHLEKEDLSECMSDVMWKIWQRVHTYDKEKSSFKSWIAMLTKGTTIDYYRKYNNEAVLSLDDGIDVEIYDDYDDNMMIIITAMQQLPPPDNEIYYRKYILGESVASIAELLNISKDSVYKRIARAKEKLKANLVKEGYYV